MASLTMLAFCQLALAADAAVSEKAFLQDFPVVLSASRLSQPLAEAPNAMTVIDRDMIRASGFRTIADLFMLVPGMYVGNLNGHSPVVGYHGSTEEYSRRMQVLVDGRSVYMPPFSTVSWEDIPLNINDIERIEVVRGPAAAAYGANSLQGVINIISRDAASVNSPEITVAKGTHGVTDATAHLGMAGEMLDYRMTVARRADDGYGSSAMNDAKASSQFNLRSSYRPSLTDNWDFQLGYSDSTRGLGVAGKSDDPYRNINVISAFQQLTWQRIQPDGNELKLQYYHINHNLVDGSYPQISPPAFIYAQTIADRHDLEFQQIARLGSSNRMVWGVGVRSDHVDSKANLARAYTLQQSRLFAHDEWRFAQSALLNAGAMLEDDGFGHVNTSPRLALNYHLDRQQTLRASTSVAYRTPAVIEEKAYIPNAYVSKGGLRPERTLSREMGYLGEFNSAKITLDVRVYDDHVSDVIFVDPAATASGLPFDFANLYAINFHGYEGTFKYRWSDSNNVIVNFSRQFARCVITGKTTNPLYVSLYFQGYMNDCPISVPDYSGSILLTRQLSNDLQFSAGYYHQGGIKMIAGRPQSIMNRVDLRLAQAFGIVGKPGNGEISLVVQNVFQDEYNKLSTKPETDNILYGRRAYVQATLIY